MPKFSKRFSLVERENIVNKASQCLWLDDGKPGREYLVKTRKLSEEVIKKFQLGYIPTFVDHQLKGRIIFPILDPSGNLIAVSSRCVGPQSGFLPVYWHESYEKSFYLYGADLARHSMRKNGFACVVEGQFDVLQLHNHGVQNVVGLSGTKMSDVQISVIQRYCDEIVLLLDTDDNQAGQMGIDKILSKSGSYQYKSGTTDPLSLKLKDFPNPDISEIQVLGERKIVPVTLSENLDPDEFICKNGIEALKKIVRGKRDDYARH